MTHQQLAVERLSDESPTNYRLSNEEGTYVGEVNWLNVNGARLSFGEGVMEIGGPAEVRLVNDGAGAKVTTE